MRIRKKNDVWPLTSWRQNRVQSSSHTGVRSINCSFLRAGELSKWNYLLTYRSQMIILRTEELVNHKTTSTILNSIRTGDWLSSLRRDMAEICHFVFNLNRVKIKFGWRTDFDECHLDFILQNGLSFFRYKINLG